MLDLLSFSEQSRGSRHCLKLSDVYGAGDERALKKVGHCAGFMRAIGHCSFTRNLTSCDLVGAAQRLEGRVVTYIIFPTKIAQSTESRFCT